MSAKRPDYVLSFLNKFTGEKSKVGAAWIKDGNISIKLNPDVTLSAGPETVLTLFPNSGSKPRVKQIGLGDERPVPPVS